MRRIFIFATLFAAGMRMVPFLPDAWAGAVGGLVVLLVPLLIIRLTVWHLIVNALRPTVHYGPPNLPIGWWIGAFAILVLTPPTGEASLLGVAAAAACVFAQGRLGSGRPLKI